jgi:hypothetical protein
MKTASTMQAEGKLGRRAFVVVGMHRSGTSAMTRTLSLLGAALPKGVMLAHEDNPSGFWEAQRVTDLNDEILQVLDSEWDDVFAFRPKQYLSNFDQYYVGRAVELLQQEFDGSELIVLKDPRISVLTTFWDRALREAGYSTHYIVMVRNPLEVAESLRVRDAFPREKSLLLWSSYMIAVDRDTRRHDRTFVSFEQLMGKWRAVRDRIQVETGIPFPRDTAAAALEIDRFLDRRLRHHRVESDDLQSRADVTDEVKTLFRIFSAACEGVEVDFAPVEKVRAELEKIEATVGPLVADLKGRTRSLSNEVIALHESRGAEQGRANALQGERDQLAAELEAKRVEAAELAAQISAREADRESIAAIAEAKSAEVDALSSRISELEVERDSVAATVEAKSAEAVILADRIFELEADCDGIAATLEASDAKVAEVSRLLEAAQAESAELRAKHDAEKERAKRIDAELEELSQRQGALSRDREELERKLRSAEAEAARSERRHQHQKRNAEVEVQKARAAVAEGEKMLTDRFRELATLTNLLREQENRVHEQQRRTEEAQEKLRWLAEVDTSIRNQPRWWSLMPKSWLRARRQRMLKVAGLFDGEAYLEANPDVRVEGQDPLQHYVNHGMRENRRRG